MIKNTNSIIKMNWCVHGGFSKRKSFGISAYFIWNFKAHISSIFHFLRRSQKNCVLNFSDLCSNVQTKATYFNHWKWERTKKTFWLKYESVYVDCYSFHCSTYVWLVLFTITYTGCCRLLICLTKVIHPMAVDGLGTLMKWHISSWVFIKLDDLMIVR